MKEIKVSLYQFDEVDRNGDMILSKGISINTDIPVLWNFDTTRPPFCMIKEKEAKKLFNCFFGKYKMVPSGIIKKLRKPTKKELIENPKLKRIIEKIEIIEMSLSLYEEEG